MTYEESAALMVNAPFRGRIKVAAIKFSTYIFGEDPASAGHASRYRWGQSFVLNPDSMAAQLQPTVVMDTSVQDAGIDAEGNSLITDAALQSAVEAVVNKIA